MSLVLLYRAHYSLTACLALTICPSYYYSILLSEGCPLMLANRSSKPVTTADLKAALAKNPGLTAKDLAGRLEVNRLFMAGFLAALEERGEVTFRKVGPASIYFNDGCEDK